MRSRSTTTGLDPSCCLKPHPEHMWASFPRCLPSPHDLSIFKSPFSSSQHLILQKIEWKKSCVQAVPLLLLAWPRLFSELSQFTDTPLGSSRKHGIWLPFQYSWREWELSPRTPKAPSLLTGEAALPGEAAGERGGFLSTWGG